MRRTGALVVAMLALASTARATPTKSQCVDANTQGQVLRKSGKLVDARTTLQTCVDPSCPSIVRSDCQAHLDEIAHAMPSIVVDTTAVTLDGKPFGGTANVPYDVDPGEHHLVFSAPGHAPIERVVTLDEAEHARRVSATFAQPQPKAAGGSSVMLTTGIAVGSAGVVGIGLGIALGIMSFGAWGSVKSECAAASTCDLVKATGDRSSALDFATGADIAFVIGGVLAAAGVTFVALGLQVHPVVQEHLWALEIVRTF